MIFKNIFLSVSKKYFEICPCFLAGLTLTRAVQRGVLEPAGSGARVRGSSLASSYTGEDSVLLKATQSAPEWGLMPSWTRSLVQGTLSTSFKPQEGPGLSHQMHPCSAEHNEVTAAAG